MRKIINKAILLCIIGTVFVWAQSLSEQTALTELNTFEGYSRTSNASNLWRNAGFNSSRSGELYTSLWTKERAMKGLPILESGTPSLVLEYLQPLDINDQKAVTATNIFIPTAAVKGTSVTFEVSFQFAPFLGQPVGFAVEDTYASIVTICPWDPKPPPVELPLNYETHHSVESYFELPSGLFYYKPSQTSFENLPDGDPDRILSNNDLTYFRPFWPGGGDYPSYKMVLIEGEKWLGNDGKEYVSEGKFRIAVNDWPENIFNIYDMRWVIFGWVYLKAYDIPTLCQRPYHLPVSNPEEPGWTIPIGVQITPSILKEDVITLLAELESSGDKKLDKLIDKAIKHVEKSLEDELWEDDNAHLVCKHGHKVFNEEKKAVKALVEGIKEINKKTSPESVSLLNAFQIAIDKLLEADMLLAQTQIDDATQPQKPEELAKANNEMAKANDEWNKGNYDKAVDHFKKAWEHAWMAMGKECGA